MRKPGPDRRVTGWGAHGPGPRLTASPFPPVPAPLRAGCHHKKESTVFIKPLRGTSDVLGQIALEENRNLSKAYNEMSRQFAIL